MPARTDTAELEGSLGPYPAAAVAPLDSATPVDAVAVLYQVSAAVSVLGVDGVEEHLAQVASVRGWLDGIEASLVSQADALAADGRGAGGRETLLLDGNASGRHATRLEHRSKTLRAAPALAAALSKGSISAEHVDAVARAARDLTDEQQAALYADPELVAQALRLRPDPFATFVRNRARQLADEPDEPAPLRLRRWVRKDGTHVLNGEFDPRVGAKIFSAIDAEVETLAQTQSMPKNEITAAVALGTLVSRGLGAGPNTTAAEVLVIDAATLRHGPHDDTVCETSSGVPLAPSTVARVMCDAVILPTVINTDSGEVLNVGRQVRVANRAQRRALRAMYPTCAFPGCHVSFDRCQIHHIVPWHEGGPTDMANLVPLCSRHHHLVHEGRWSMSLDSDRTLRVTEPDGRHYTTEPLPGRRLAAALASWPSGEDPPHHLVHDRPGNNRAA